MTSSLFQGPPGAPSALLQGIANPAQATFSGAFQSFQAGRKEKEFNEIAAAIFKNSPGAKVADLMRLNPAGATEFANAVGIPLNATDRIKSAMGGVVIVSKMLQAGVDPNDVAKFMSEQAQLIAQGGGDTSFIQRGIKDLSSGNEQLILAQADAFKQLADSFDPIDKSTAGQKEFLSLTTGLSPKDISKAKRIELGLDPRAVGSGSITTATTEGLTEKIAASEETIKQRVKFAEMTGSSRVKAIDKSFTTIQSINKNVRNIDRAITALEGGASTGAVKRFFPSIRKASVMLDQIQSELGLDVVGATTFGALSAGELALAKAVALPTGLKPAALIEHLQERRAAQEKLLDYYNSQIQHLDQGGSIASFLRGQERQGPATTPNVGRFQIEVLE